MHRVCEACFLSTGFSIWRCSLMGFPELQSEYVTVHVAGLGATFSRSAFSRFMSFLLQFYLSLNLGVKKCQAVATISTRERAFCWCPSLAPGSRKILLICDACREFGGRAEMWSTFNEIKRDDVLRIPLRPLPSRAPGQLHSCRPPLPAHAAGSRRRIQGNQGSAR